MQRAAEVLIALLAVVEPPLRAPRTDLMRALSRCLLAAGDSIPLPGEAEELPTLLAPYGAPRWRPGGS